MKISIVGLGLMGASLAWQLKESGITVKGYARRQETIDQALSLKLINEGSTYLEDIIQDVDLIVICLPIELIPQTVQKIDVSLDKETIVTDIGSIKKFIMNAVTKLDLTKALFVGGHPMAGSEKVGLDNYKKNLYKDKPYIFTYPSPEIKTKAQETLKNFTQTLKAEYLEHEAEEHDKLISIISHLPYFNASILYNRYLENKEILQGVASTGFKDTTRVAHSDPYWGLAVGLLNSKNITSELDHMILKLNYLKDIISNKKIEELYDFVNIDGSEANTEKLNLVKKMVNAYYNISD